jgi:hypothetical protein
MVVRITRIVDGCLDNTWEVHCKDYDGCMRQVDALAKGPHERGVSYVGCIKAGDKIKFVF